MSVDGIFPVMTENLDLLRESYTESYGLNRSQQLLDTGGLGSAGWIPSSLTSPLAALGDKCFDKLHANRTLEPSSLLERTEFKTCLKSTCLGVILLNAAVIHSKIHLFEFHCPRQVDWTDCE